MGPVMTTHTKTKKTTRFSSETALLFMYIANGGGCCPLRREQGEQPGRGGPINQSSSPAPLFAK